MPVPAKIIVSILFSAVVGSISFSGSMIAFGKLQEMISGSPVVVPGQRIVTGALVAAVLVLCVILGTGRVAEAAVVSYGDVAGPEDGTLL